MRRRARAWGWTLLFAVGAGGAGEGPAAPPPESFPPAYARAVVAYAEDAMAATRERRRMRLEAISLAPFDATPFGVHLAVARGGELVAQEMGLAPHAHLPGNLLNAGRRLAETYTDPDPARDALLVTVLFFPGARGSRAGKPLVPLLRGETALGLAAWRGAWRGTGALLPPLEILMHEYDWDETLFRLAALLAPSAASAPGAPLSLAEINRLTTEVLQDDAFALSYVPTVTLAKLPGAAEPAVLYRMGRWLPPAEATRAAATRACEAAGTWLADALARADACPGRFRRDGTPEGAAETTAVFAGAEALARLAALCGRPAWRAVAADAVRAAVDRHYLEVPKTRSGLLRDDDAGELRLTAEGLSAFAAVEGEPARAERMANFLLGQERDGEFDAAYPSTGRRNLRAGAEAVLALLAWDARKTAPALKPVLVKLAAERYAASPAPVPAARLTAAAAALYRATSEQAMADLAFRLAEDLADFQQAEAAWPGPHPRDEDGQWGPARRLPHLLPRLSDTALATGALARAAGLARALGENARAERFGAAAHAGVRRLMQAQMKDGYDLLASSRPDALRGGFRDRQEFSSVGFAATARAAAALADALEFLPAPAWPGDAP